MDDVEAEAVLRVLAEQLQWVSLGRHTWAGFTLPDGFRGRYFVHEREVKGTVSEVTQVAGSVQQRLYLYDAEVLVSSDLRRNSPGYKTRAEAKAACECHLATGKWK